MSVSFTRASSQYLRLNDPLVGQKPVTMAAWIKTVDASNHQGIISITDDSDEFLLIQARMATDGDPAGTLEYKTDWKYAESSTSISTATWHHVCGVFLNATSRTIYLDGAGKVINTDSQDVYFDALTMLLIGTHRTGGSGSYFDGEIAEVSIWQRELSDAEVALLAGGELASNIDDTNLKGYWPLLIDASSAIGGDSLEGVNSPTYDSTSHPSVFNYPQQNTITTKRLVVAGSDMIWYENV